MLSILKNEHLQQEICKYMDPITLCRLSITCCKVNRRLVFYTNTANKCLVEFLQTKLQDNLISLIEFFETHSNQFVTQMCLTFLNTFVKEQNGMIQIDRTVSQLQTGLIDHQKILKFLKLQKLLMKKKEIFGTSSEFLKYTLVFSGINFQKTTNQVLEKWPDLDEEHILVKLKNQEYSRNEFFIDLNQGTLATHAWLKNTKAMFKNLTCLNMSKAQFNLLMNNIELKQLGFYKDLCAKQVEFFCEWFENQEFLDLDILQCSVQIIDCYLTEKNTPFFQNLVNVSQRQLGTFLHCISGSATCQAQVRSQLSSCLNHSLQRVHGINWPVDSNLLDLWRTMLAEQSDEFHTRKRSSHIIQHGTGVEQTDKKIGVDVSTFDEFESTDDDATDVESQSHPNIFQKDLNKLMNNQQIFNQ